MPDLKVFINGEELDLGHEKYFVRSAFAHVEKEINQEETGKVLNIHAKGVPLGLFLKSLGIEFNNECLAIDNEKFCSGNGKKLRFFVNGKENNQFGDYIPKDLDKILISYGNEEELIEQLNKLTDYAKNH